LKEVTTAWSLWGLESTDEKRSKQLDNILVKDFCRDGQWAFSKCSSRFAFTHLQVVHC